MTMDLLDITYERSLKLRLSSYGQNHIEEFAEKIGCDTNLESLEITRFFSGWSKESQEKLVSSLLLSLKNSKSLKFLKISSLDSLNVIHLKEFLEQNDTLEELKLQAVNLNAQQVDMIFDALAKSTSVKSFYISRSHIGETQILCKMLRENKTIEKLYLNNMGINDGILKDIMEAIIENDNISVLSLLNNRARDFTPLGEYIGASKSIQDLSLVFNHVGDSGAEALAKGIQKNNSLQKLQFSDCHIGSSGCEALAKALESKPEFYILILTANDIDTRGYLAISQLLQSENCNIQQLNLSWNKTDSLGAVSIFKALKTNTSLEALYMHGVVLDEISTAYLDEALKVNRTIKNLSIQLDGDFYTHIVSILRRNNKLRFFYVEQSRTQFNEHSSSEIVEAYEQNSKLLYFRISLKNYDDRLKEIQCRNRSNEKQKKATLFHMLLKSM